MTDTKRQREIIDRGALAEEIATLRAVATDGHRLARIDTELPEGAEDAPGVIVPRKTVNELRKLLEDDEAEIAISVSETKIRFTAGDLVLTSKVIDGAFPDYSRVIPTGNTRRLEVDAAEFAQAVDVIRMEVGEQHRRDLPLRQPHARKYARRACASVDDIDTLAGDHSRARPRALRVRQRRAGAAKRHMEPVGKLV